MVVELDSGIIRSSLPTLGGTYVLVFQSDAGARIRVGRLGDMMLRPGFYLYVGSAFGPGGLRSRVGRHATRHKPLRWHIDYLRRHALLRAVVFSVDPERHEDAWSGQIQAWPETSIPMTGFGASDSPAETHLFYLEARPSGAWFEALEGTGIQILDSGLVED